MMNCMEYALYYTSNFPKTEKELTVQLMQKGYFSEDIAKTMEFLKDKNYVNDEKFAESYIRSECINKGKPLIVITNKLYEKGVDRNILNKKVREFEEEIQDGIFNRIRKEIASYKKKNEDGFDIIQKLLRKGYKMGDIKDVIEKNK